MSDRDNNTSSGEGNTGFEGVKYDDIHIREISSGDRRNDDKACVFKCQQSQCTNKYMIPWFACQGSWKWTCSKCKTVNNY